MPLTKDLMVWLLLKETAIGLFCKWENFNNNKNNNDDNNYYNYNTLFIFCYYNLYIFVIIILYLCLIFCYYNYNTLFTEGIPPNSTLMDFWNSAGKTGAITK